MSLMPDDSVEIHSIETQTLVQTLPSPPHYKDLPYSIIRDRMGLFMSLSGFAVPSEQRSAKLRSVNVALLRRKKSVIPETPTQQREDDDVEEIIGLL